MIETNPIKMLAEWAVEPMPLTPGKRVPAGIDVGYPHFDTVRLIPEGEESAGFVEVASCSLLAMAQRREPQAPEYLFQVGGKNEGSCRVHPSRVYPVTALPTLVCRWLLKRER